MQNMKEWLTQEPDVDVATLIEGGRYIPIETAENLLDLFDSWSTQNFNYYLYKGEGYGNLGVAASLELVVEYMGKGNPVRRTLIGACNFTMKSIAPNTHFMATAKSECVKNAMSDLGKRFGRGLNANMPVPDPANALAANGGVDMLSSVGEIKLKTNAKKI